MANPDDAVLVPIDLGGGKLTEEQKLLFDHQRNKAIQGLIHQKVAFYFSVGFATLMTLAFLVFARKVVLLSVSKSGAFDWHLLLLGSGLIVPPTIIIFALIRRLYPNEESKNGKADDDTPAAGLITEMSGMMKEVTELVGVVTEKFGGKK